MDKRDSSVVVFDLDGLSIRTAGCYGNVEVHTPELDEFAAQAQVFEQHYRAFVDVRTERDHALESLQAATGLQGLRISNEPDAAESHRFTALDELAGLLEDHFDTEGQAAWIRFTASQPDSLPSLPLGLITKLVEADVAVAVTSTSPVPAGGGNVVDCEDAIRVPLMVFSTQPDRLQTVSSSEQLADRIAGEDSDEPVVIVGTEAIAMREPDLLTIVDCSLMEELVGTSDAELIRAIDETDVRLRMFRKPDDVWNVHNVLSEDFERGVAAVVRLRAAM